MTNYRNTKRFFKVTVTFFILFFTYHNIFADTFCDEALAEEKRINKTLPKKVDEYTELTQVSVNCDKKVFKYSKRISAYESDLASGWRSRKQRQHTQMHCNADGTASKYGWTVIDVVYDKEFNYLITLKTTPRNCS